MGDDAGGMLRARSSTFDTATSPYAKNKLLEPKEAQRIARLGVAAGLQPPTCPVLKFSPPRNTGMCTRYPSIFLFAGKTCNYFMTGAPLLLVAGSLMISS
jgi:hypothetical protein